MAIMLNEEIKEVVMKTYNRCYKIDIKSVLNADKTYTETIHQYYEKVTEIDGEIVSKTPVYETEYLSSSLLGITWTSPWGKEITGLDVMAFIKKFNDNYEEAIKNNTMPNG